MEKSNMKYKDYLTEEEMKHKLYTKEEIRDIKAKKKGEISNTEETNSAENPDEKNKPVESENNDESTVDSVLSEIKSALKDVTEDTDIVTDGDIYIAKEDSKEYLGYFIYKKEIGEEQDDFYVGKFIYRIKEQKLESLVDDIEESFKNIAEAEAYIKSYKGQKV